jgi:hypothetical protein
LEQSGYQFVYDVLQGLVQLDVGSGRVDHHLADGTVTLDPEMFDYATSTERVETFYDGRGVDVVTAAKDADQVRVDVAQEGPGWSHSRHSFGWLRQGSSIARSTCRNHFGALGLPVSGARAFPRRDASVATACHLRLRLVALSRTIHTTVNTAANERLSVSGMDCDLPGGCILRSGR